MRRKIITSVFGILLYFISIPYALAYNWVAEAKVTAVEVTYMPQSLPFYLDQPVGECAAGNPLTWIPRGSTADEKIQNAQSVLSVLLTAKTSGQKVMAFVIADGCKVEYIYLR